MPATVISPDSAQRDGLDSPIHRAALTPARLSFTNPILTGGLRYWFSDVNWDEQNHLLSGYFNVGTSVRDLYTLACLM
jgi:hypothetical protein